MVPRAFAILSAVTTEGVLYARSAAPWGSIELEPFGGDAVRLTRAAETVMDLEEANLGAIEAIAGGEDLAKALACRGSKKFGESLTREEMVSLLREWSSCEFEEICPHGRPIVKRISLAELLREFGRV